MKLSYDKVPDFYLKSPVLSKEEESLIFKRLDCARTKIFGENRDEWFTEESIGIFKKYVNSKEDGCSLLKRDIHRLTLGCSKYVMYVISGLPKITVSVSEQFQEGMISINELAYRYDSRIQARFLTFVSMSVCSRIKDHRLKFFLPVRIPSRVNDIRRHINKNPELVNHPHLIKESMDSIYKSPVSLDLIHDVIAEPEFISSNSYSPDHPDLEIGDLIASGSDTYDDASVSLLLNKISKCLMSIKPSYAKILMDKYGFNAEEKEYSHTELGEKFSLSREGVRQIEIRVLNQIRNMIGNVELDGQGKENVTSSGENNHPTHKRSSPRRRVTTVLGGEKGSTNKNGKAKRLCSRSSDPV